MTDEPDQTADPKESEESEHTGLSETDRGDTVEADTGAGDARSGWLAAYLAAFVLVVAAMAVMGFGGLSLLRTRSSIEGSTTLFWVSIVLAIVSIVLAGVALALSRDRR